MGDNDEITGKEENPFRTKSSKSFFPSEKNPFFSDETKAEVSVDEVVRKKRNADYYYENFRRAYRNKDLKKSSEYLWDIIRDLSYCVGLFRNKKLDNFAKIIEFLGELSKEGEITKEQVGAVQAIHTNALRNVLDEPMFEIYRERAERTIRKLKDILRDKLVSRISE